MPCAYGLIGYPLTHSFSPAYFAEKFARDKIDAVYSAFPLKTIADFPELLRTHSDICGLNVTIPYKESVIPYLDELDTIAQKVGAVNCIAFDKGKRIGYNTDAAGFEKSLLPLLQPQHKLALILGTGGASKAVAYVLQHAGIAYKYVSRKKSEGAFTYSELTSQLISEHLLIINTTPVGMWPDSNKCPGIPYEAITPRHLLYDLIYNPAETRFLMLGGQRGAQTKNGLEMLQLQADAGWEIWNK